VNQSPTNIIDDLRLLEAPQPLTLLQWLAIAGVLLAVAGAILWLRARARRGSPPSPAVIQAAQEDALAELQKLRGQMTRENSRAYAIAVSGVVRRYLERRFGLLAPRRSTEEFLAEARASGRLDESHQRNLSDFLAACDFLKFARAIADAPELEQIHTTAVRFVTDTQSNASDHGPRSESRLQAAPGQPSARPPKGGTPNPKSASAENGGQTLSPQPPPSA
jgi:hypothetical protein